MGKIKQFIDSDKGRDLLTITIVILVGLASFELGRLSKENGSSGITIQYPSASLNQGASDASAVKPNDFSKISPAATTNTSASARNSVNPAGKPYFASNRGSKYYSNGCSGGKTIKQENRIYFATGGEAERAGYALSSSCK